MDFELSGQQAAFRDLMRDFTRRSIAPVAREWELSGRYPTEIVDEMKKMGLFGMLVPEEYGGIGIDAVSYAVVFEEISKAWMGIAGILGSLAGDGTAGKGRHRGAAAPMAARPCDGQATLGNRAYRAWCRQ
jgi:alkylation response protein AidB-like acyl-CoA dehydrogenase